MAYDEGRAERVGHAALDGAPRPIRRIGPPVVPWPAVLASVAEDSPCLLVSTREPSVQLGWELDPGPHIAAATDLVRVEDGHLAVLPSLSAPLSELLDRRRRARTALTDGETVTLAVSLMRGVFAAREATAGAPVPGRWWVTPDGRPMFVCLPDEEDIAHAAAIVLDEIPTDPDGSPAVDAALAQLRTMWTQPRLSPSDLDEAERALFSAAEPEPLATSICAPMPSRELSIASMETGTSTATGDAEAEPWWTRVIPDLDRPLREMIGAATTAIWRRGRTDRPRRGHHGRALIVAGAIAVAVLVVGLSWPSGSDDAAAQASARMAAGQTPTPAPTPSAGRRRPKPSPSADSASAPVDVARNLLDLHRGCADDRCRALTQSDPAAELPHGAVDAEDVSLSLIDDYGGAAVLRAHDDDSTPSDQIVVMVREDGRWLLRRIRRAVDDS